jgi:predicted nucleotidyltransferase
VRSVQETLRFLEVHHPQYVFADPVQGLTFSFVPTHRVRHYYVPEERLAQILADPCGLLEKEVTELVETLIQASGLPRHALGITGSILLGMHNPAFSDIDLTVYGRGHALALRQVVERLKGTRFQEIDPVRREQWRRETGARFDLGPDDVAYLETRRWNYFLFRGRCVSVHPTRADGEIHEEYGDRRYRARGAATIEATVVEASEALFLPAIYRLGDVRGIEGAASDVETLVSFEGLYCDAADPGDRILARGHVETATGAAPRLVVGAASLTDGGFVKISQRG